MSRNHRLKWYLSHSWSKHINHLQQEPWCWFRQVQHLLLCHCCGRRDSLCWDSRRQFEPDHSWTRSKYDPQCLRQCEVRCCHIIWPSSRDWAIWVTNRCSCCCLVARHLRPRSSRCAFRGLWIYWKAAPDLVQDRWSAPYERWWLSLRSPLPLWFWTHY